jgi:hypothetical protein
MTPISTLCSVILLAALAVAGSAQASDAGLAANGGAHDRGSQAGWACQGGGPDEAALPRTDAPNLLAGMTGPATAGGYGGAQAFKLIFACPVTSGPRV